jgi:Tol biopolymer transport system component
MLEMGYQKFLVLGLLFIAFVVVTAAEEPPKDEAIVFTSDPSLAYSDIYLLRLSDKKVFPFITGAYAKFLTWSPVENRLAFVSLRTDGDNIFVLDLDDYQSTQLTQNDAFEAFLRWSPDGQQIAFATEVTGDWEVFVIDADGANLKNLTKYPKAADGVSGLDWSPDGKQIVFVSNRNGRPGLYTMYSDGSNPRLLISNEVPFEDRQAVWSPRGNRMAFISHRFQEGIYTVNVDGSNLRYITPRDQIPKTGHHTNLAWSLDGSRIVFQLCEGTTVSCELYIMNEDGTNLAKLTDNGVYEAYPIWMSITKLDSFPIFLPNTFSTPEPTPSSTS